MAAGAERVLPGRVEVHPCRVSRSATWFWGCPAACGAARRRCCESPCVVSWLVAGRRRTRALGVEARLPGCATEYGPRERSRRAGRGVCTFAQLNADWHCLGRGVRRAARK